MGWWSDLASCLSKKLMIYLGFPTEPEKTEARRTDFSRYFRQLDNPAYKSILLICGSAYVLAWIIFHLGVPQIKPVKIKESMA